MTKPRFDRKVNIFVAIVMYCTVKHNSGGYHGHQLKDWLGGLTISKVFNLDMIKKPYTYLDSFAIGDSYPCLPAWPMSWTYGRPKKLAGPYWDGFNHLEDIESIVRPVLEEYSNRLLVMEKALRIHPFQTIRWYQEGLIQRNVFDEVLTETTQDYLRRHGEYKRGEELNIAIHISRGVDYNPEKFPEHFTDSYNVRYMFSLEYFDQIIDLINSHYSGPKTFHIYTEALHGEDIADHYQSQSNCHVHIGSNRREKNERLIQNIFKNFVYSDILVACNSSFSAMCSYFRKNKITIYHPHKHLDHLPEPHFVPSDPSGMFDADLLTFCLKEHGYY